MLEIDRLYKFRAYSLRINHFDFDKFSNLFLAGNIILVKGRSQLSFVYIILYVETVFALGQEASALMECVIVTILSFPM